MSLNAAMAIAADALTIDELMTGLMRRARAVESGALTYSFESGISDREDRPINQLPARTTTFSDAMWIERDPLGNSAVLHVDDTVLQFDETSQPDGTVRRTALLSKSTRPKLRVENRPPVFAGTFWDLEQLAYVRRHRKRFRVEDPQEIAGIRCVPCVHTVSAEDVAQVVSVVHPRLAAGAMLRLYVAPALGFVLPRIEVLAPDGATVVTYQSSEFQTVDGDLSFPRRTRMEMALPNGMRRYEQFSIMPARINEDVPDSELAISLHHGTHVRDERDPAQVRRYTLAKASTSSELLGIARPRSTPGGLQLKWILGVGVVLVSILTIAALFRRVPRGTAND